MINPLMPDWTDRMPCEDPIYSKMEYVNFEKYCVDPSSSEWEDILNNDTKFQFPVDLCLPFDD